MNNSSGMEVWGLIASSNLVVMISMAAERSTLVYISTWSNVKGVWVVGQVRWEMSVTTCLKSRTIWRLLDICSIICQFGSVLEVTFIGLDMLGGFWLCDIGRGYISGLRRKCKYVSMSEAIGEGEAIIGRAG